MIVYILCPSPIECSSATNPIGIIKLDIYCLASANLGPIKRL